jgi:hypothetical protein
MPETLDTSRLRSVTVKPTDIELLEKVLIDAPDHEDSVWRRAQLLELVQMLPLPEGSLPCPACGGGGDHRPPGCPGPCCQVCSFCLGRRFFLLGELQSVTDYDRGDSAVNARYVKSAEAERATDGFLMPSLLETHGKGVSLIVSPVRALNKGRRHSPSSKCGFLIVKEDARLLLSLGTLCFKDAPKQGWVRLSHRLESAFDLGDRAPRSLMK